LLFNHYFLFNKRRTAVFIACGAAESCRFRAVSPRTIAKPSCSRVKWSRTIALGVARLQNGLARSANLGNLFAFGGGRGTANCSNYSKLRRLLYGWFYLNKNEKNNQILFQSELKEQKENLNQIVKDSSDFFSIRMKKIIRVSPLGGGENCGSWKSFCLRRGEFNGELL